MRILLCGGAGYIGAHTYVVLVERGHDVVVADNFSNSSPGVLARLRQITGRPVPFQPLDLRDRDAVTGFFAHQAFDAVVHFAALKSVGESCERPLDYFHNNIGGTLNLLHGMREAGVDRLVFSSSATVYGDPDHVPVREDARLQVTNPYGRTKLVMEELIGDLCRSDAGFHAANLRYFNPVGAHASGLIGEDPTGIPNNLMPYICQVAVGRRDRLSVFGGDWPTVDGTGVRDYIHVCDLASGHVAALNWMNGKTGVEIFNLGTGTGTSVLEVVAAFSKACGKELPYVIRERRAGDIAANWCDASKAERMMGWKAQYDIADMCRDSWNWQSHNPNGFADAE